MTMTAGQQKVEARQKPGKRGFWTYRGWKRNAAFGRKPVGNTKPQEREAARATYQHAVERAQ